MKRFRFSLLSLLVGVMLAGGVLYLNLRPVGVYYTLVDDDTHEPSLVLVARNYGWPTWAYQDGIWEMGISDIHSWSYAAFDIAIGLAIVFGGAGVCEYVVRRRAAKAKE